MGDHLKEKHRGEGVQNPKQIPLSKKLRPLPLTLIDSIHDLSHQNLRFPNQNSNSAQQKKKKRKTISIAISPPDFPPHMPEEFYLTTQKREIQITNQDVIAIKFG